MTSALVIRQVPRNGSLSPVVNEIAGEMERMKDRNWSITPRMERNQYVGVDVIVVAVY